MSKRFTGLVAMGAAGLLAVAGVLPAAAQDKTELVMGSWRVDDVDQMNRILDVFHAEHPDITVKFDPTNPPDYNATLRSQLEAGTGPDVMYLRSFSTSRQLYDEGFLSELSDVPQLMTNFTEGARSPWATDDAVPYGVPFIAVSHGIYYNVDLFDELGLSVPTTWDELLATAQAIQEAGYDAIRQRGGRRVDHGRDRLHEPRADVHRRSRGSPGIPRRRALLQRRERGLRVPGGRGHHAVPARRA